ncbi:hypothetical protein Tsubulata_051531 [Turnera subulata]|uniref:Uncharacterized protein n=1 Tax=Turnera subulata TaxID=218843 RepID=A0A9Q0GA00_9ROSI|nr:hypothetical protein Tsubulata_051531 [Turnera subulata]
MTGRIRKQTARKSTGGKAPIRQLGIKTVTVRKSPSTSGVVKKLHRIPPRAVPFQQLFVSLINAFYFDYDPVEFQRFVRNTLNGTASSSVIPEELRLMSWEVYQELDRFTLGTEFLRTSIIYGRCNILLHGDSDSVSDDLARLLEKGEKRLKQCLEEEQRLAGDSERWVSERKALLVEKQQLTEELRAKVVKITKLEEKLKAETRAWGTRLVTVKDKLRQSIRDKEKLKASTGSRIAKAKVDAVAAFRDSNEYRAEINTKCLEYMKGLMPMIRWFMEDVCLDPEIIQCCSDPNELTRLKAEMVRSLRAVRGVPVPALPGNVSPSPVVSGSFPGC